MKKTFYRVNDYCESPQIYETLESALEQVKELLNGIDIDYPIEITKIKMTQDEYNQLPGL